MSIGYTYKAPIWVKGVAVKGNSRIQTSTTLLCICMNYSQMNVFAL